MYRSLCLLIAIVFVFAHANNTTIPCTFQYQSDRYDLSPLANSTHDYKVAGEFNQTFWINVCVPLATNSCKVEGAAGCQEFAPNEFMTIGLLNTTTFDGSSSSGISLSFDLGEEGRSFEIVFGCNETGGIGAPLFKTEQPKLHYVFYWNTQYACALPVPTTAVATTAQATTAVATTAVATTAQATTAKATTAVATTAEATTAVPTTAAPTTANSSTTAAVTTGTGNRTVTTGSWNGTTGEWNGTTGGWNSSTTTGHSNGTTGRATTGESNTTHHITSGRISTTSFATTGEYCDGIPKQDCIDVCGAGHVKSCKCINHQPVVECDTAGAASLFGAFVLAMVFFFNFMLL